MHISEILNPKETPKANRAMLEKVKNGDAIDLSKNEKNKNGRYILKRFVEDMDYCDLMTGEWIWSIGKHLTTGEILASTDTEFYMHPDYVCLFLR